MTGFFFTHDLIMSQTTEGGAFVFTASWFACETETRYPACRNADRNVVKLGWLHLMVAQSEPVV